MIRTTLLLVTLIASLFAPAASAQVIIGGPALEGFLRVRGADSPDQLVFEVDGDVRIGRSGSNSVDTDLFIYDPNHPEEMRPALAFNADAADLTLGSGSGVPGDDGDLFLQGQNGVNTFHLNGAVADITLGGDGEAGDILVKLSTGGEAFRVTGSNANVTNAFGGEGLVKGWCRVDPAGNFIDGWRCTNDANFPTRLGTGVYRVDMTALSTDLNPRPYVVSCSSPSNQVISCGMILAQIVPSDLSVISVGTRNPLTGNPIDSPFTIVFY